MTKAWHVGKTNDQQELLAASNLRAQGYAVYLPKLYTRHQEGKKIEARSQLRFTGYICIAFAEGEHGPISNTRGMDSPDGGSALIVGGPERRPVSLPRGIIETLRQIEDEELHRALARTKPKPRTDLTPGDVVTIGGDRQHPAYGRRGHYLGSEKGFGSVLEGIYVWKNIPEGDLRKIEQQDRKAA